MDTGPANMPIGQGRRVCLFAQFNRKPTLPRATFHYLEKLNEAGFETILAMSGKDRVDDADRALLDRLGVHARPRPNAGLDFGAWAMLIGEGAADGADQILLANDSVFGPFAPLAPIVRDMAGFDAWGMVESREGRPHLQSWFVCLSGDAFRRASVRRLWSQPFETMSKPEIVVHGELGLGAAMEAEDLDVGARYRSVFRVRPSSAIATNPMHFRWRALLATGAVPFIKAELLRDNPSRILGTAGWRHALREAGVEDLSMIEEGLAGSTPNRGPLGLKQTLLQLAVREDRLSVIRESMSRVAPGHEKAGSRRR